MSSHIIFQCPACSSRRITAPDPPFAPVRCDGCGWSRDEGQADFHTGSLCRCRICGCQDLWRQKDFPPALGLTIVAAAAVASCTAWAWYQPVLAIGFLMVAALLDMFLYSFMGDMLVCYRCAARHRKSQMRDDHPRFDLETAERYRQQDLKRRSV